MGLNRPYWNWNCAPAVHFAVFGFELHASPILYKYSTVKFPPAPPHSLKRRAHGVVFERAGREEGEPASRMPCMRSHSRLWSLPAPTARP